MYFHNNHICQIIFSIYIYNYSHSFIEDEVSGNSLPLLLKFLQT